MKSTQLCGCQAVTRAALHARLPKLDAVLRSECRFCSPSRATTTQGPKGALLSCGCCTTNMHESHREQTLSVQC